MAQKKYGLRALRAVRTMSLSEVPTHAEFKAAWIDGLIDFTVEGYQVLTKLRNGTIPDPWPKPKKLGGVPRLLRIKEKQADIDLAEELATVKRMEASGECLACGREPGKHNAGCPQR